MSRFWLIAVSLLVCAPSFADEPLPQEEYAKKHALVQGAYTEAIDSCLHAWGEHPFGDASSLQVRVIETGVRVMGFGSKEPVDDDVTAYDQMVLVMPSVNALTKTTYQFLNPRGWYCFHTSVTALGSSVVKIHCDAKLADATAGVNVLSTDTREGGVVVLGNSEVKRLCD